MYMRKDLKLPLINDNKGIGVTTRDNRNKRRTEGCSNEEESFTS